MAEHIKRNPDNVVAFRHPDEIAETKPVETKPAPGGLSTGAKVAVGAGITGGLGLAAFGAYQLGKRLGWWGQAHSVIVIDDRKDSKDGGGSSDGGTSGGGSSGGGSSGGSPSGRASGKPPNISGDPEGYNTTRFPSPGPVRMALITMGYKVEANDETLVPNNKPNAEVRRFQTDWNRVIRGIDSGKVKLPDINEPQLKHYRGLLDEDGIPGKNTLNALEIVWTLMLRHVFTLRWSQLVGQIQ